MGPATKALDPAGFALASARPLQPPPQETTSRSLELWWMYRGIHNIFNNIWSKWLMYWGTCKFIWGSLEPWWNQVIIWYNMSQMRQVSALRHILRHIMTWFRRSQFCSFVEERGKHQATWSNYTSKFPTMLNDDGSHRYEYIWVWAKTNDSNPSSAQQSQIFWLCARMRWSFPAILPCSKRCKSPLANLGTGRLQQQTSGLNQRRLGIS